MPNDFNPPPLPSNPASGLSPRPEQASPRPVWWTSNSSAEWPIPAATNETRCGFCQGVPSAYVLSSPTVLPDGQVLALPVKDQVIEKKPLTWLGSLLPEYFDNANDAFVNFQLNLEPMLYYSFCNWRSRLRSDVTVEVTGTQPPVFKSLSLRWYLFYGETGTGDEYANGAPAVFGPLGLNGLFYSGGGIRAAANNASRFATGPRHYPEESQGLFLGPDAFDELEEIQLSVQGWSLVLLHRFTDNALNPVSGLEENFPRWALAAAYTVSGRFKCCEPTTWNLAYNPCNQPVHQIVTTPYQP